MNNALLTRNLMLKVKIMELEKMGNVKIILSILRGVRYIIVMNCVRNVIGKIKMKAKLILIINFKCMQKIKINLNN